MDVIRAGKRPQPESGSASAIREVVQGGEAARQSGAGGRLRTEPLGTHGKSPSLSHGLEGCQQKNEGLGSTAKSASTLPTVAVIRRYALQSVARSLLADSRALQGCCRWLQREDQGVQLLHVPRHRVGSLRGLQHCGSVWQCPVCSSKITERRRVELTTATAAAAERGWTVLLVTYTMRHRSGDSLSKNLAQLVRAREGVWSGKWAQEFRARHGVEGRIRALEVTHGKNGWHPHVHELVFLSGQVDRIAFLAELRTVWSKRLRRVGAREVNVHGLDVRFADISVAEYVAKFGYERTWYIEHELTKAAVKGAKNGNRGPIGLLTAYLEGDDAAGNLWREYAHEFKRSQQLVWSDGLRKKLALAAEKSDQELAEHVREDAVMLDELSRLEWRSVLGNDAQAELLLVLGTGSREELRGFLRSIGIDRPEPAMGTVLWSLAVQIERDRRASDAEWAGLFPKRPPAGDQQNTASPGFRNVTQRSERICAVAPLSLVVAELA